MRRLISVGLLIYAITCLTVLAASYAVPRGTPSQPSDAIVVLAAGIDETGVIDPVTTRRVAKGIALFEAGHAPRLHMTGGTIRDGAAPSGQQMAEYALAAGLPAEAISFEGGSHSTLQNALFSLPMLEDAPHLTLVTDGFHLPRSTVSFLWAGDKELTIVATDAPPDLRHVLREGLAIWFNAARVAGHWVLARLGVAEDRLVPWLA